MSVSQQYQEQSQQLRESTEISPNSKKPAPTSHLPLPASWDAHKLCTSLWSQLGEPHIFSQEGKGFRKKYLQDILFIYFSSSVNTEVT